MDKIENNINKCQMTTGKKIGLEWSRLCLIFIAVLMIIIIVEYIRTGKILPMTTAVLGYAMAGLGITWTAKATSNFAQSRKLPVLGQGIPADVSADPDQTKGV